MALALPGPLSLSHFVKKDLNSFQIEVVYLWPSNCDLFIGSYFLGFDTLVWRRQDGEQSRKLGDTECERMTDGK